MPEIGIRAIEKGFELPVRVLVSFRHSFKEHVGTQSSFWALGLLCGRPDGILDLTCGRLETPDNFRTSNPRVCFGRLRFWTPEILAGV